MLTMVDDKNLGFSLGATDYLTKPIERERLNNILKKYCYDNTGGSVLIIEDDPLTRQMLHRILEKEGWKVREAENGRVGLQRVNEMAPVLILLDLMMPEMDGFQFVHELHKNPNYRSIPIVLLTAKDITPEDHQHGSFGGDGTTPAERTEVYGDGVHFVSTRPGKLQKGAQDFATGWIKSGNKEYWGRTVAPLVGADGALYISDDNAGAIYRISYNAS